MTFSLILTITHTDFPAEKQEYVDMYQANSKNSMLRQLNIDNKKICDLRSFGKTSWVDSKKGGLFTLELRQEDN